MRAEYICSSQFLNLQFGLPCPRKICDQLLSCQNKNCDFCIFKFWCCCMRFLTTQCSSATQVWFTIVAYSSLRLGAFRKLWSRDSVDKAKIKGRIMYTPFKKILYAVIGQKVLKLWRYFVKRKTWCIHVKFNFIHTNILL